MVSSTSVVLALAFAAGAHASVSDPIAGYYPGSDVAQHNKVDISAKALSNFLGGKQYDGDALETSTSAERYVLATKMYAKGTGSSPYVTYTVKAPADAMDPKAGTWTCAEDSTGNGNFDLALGKFAGKKTIAADATGASLKVYMGDASWGSAECGKVPFRGGGSGVGDGETKCAKLAADLDDGANPTCADQYIDTSCPGGGVDFASPHADMEVTCSKGSDSRVYEVTGATSYGGRTLKGFSTAVQAKMIDGPTRAEPEAVAAKAFHTVASYGDMTISAALEGLTAGASSFSTCSAPATAIDAVGCTDTWTQGTAICKHTDTRAPMINLVGSSYALQKTACVNAGGKVTDFFLYREDGDDKKKLTIEVIQKMAVYTNAWLYTIHEFEDAIADCEGSTLHDNDEGVHAWDEGVAFYTGSNAGEKGHYTAAGDVGGDGNMIYALANKRCKNFKTCGDGERTGNSAVNIALFNQFSLGMNACQTGNCPEAQGYLDKIIPLMSVPLIQGTLRYAYKVAVLQEAYKGYGEGYAFMMSVVHRVGACSAADAKIIYEALDIPDVDPGLGNFKLGGTATAPGKNIAAYTVVKGAFERNYKCMGITCADVGSLHNDNGVAMPGAEACIDPSPAAAADAGTNTVTEKDVLPTWAIIAIAGAGALMVLFFGMMCAYKSSKDMTIKMYNDLKKEGAVGKV